MSTASLVTAITWDRVNLSITVALASEPSGTVEFHILDQERDFPVRTTALGGGSYCLDFNITNFQDRKQVPDGTWRLVAYVDGKQRATARWHLDDLERLEELSRTFVYAGNKVAYIVRFGISEDDDPVFLMRTYQMFRNPKPLNAEPTPIKARVRNRLLPRARRLKIANQWYRLARRLSPPPGNRILFASEMRTRNEGNLLRIHDRMIERGLDKRFEFRYSFRVPQEATRKNTLRVVWLLATSDIVIVDDYFGLLESLQLAPETKIIQAWHAGSGFKNIGYSRFGTYGSPKLQNAHRKYTYAITGSKHLIPVYAEAFGIEEAAVIPTGLPRIDTFLDPARTEKVTADFAVQYPHLLGKKILLFAPTFRGRGATTAYYDYDRLDFGKLYDSCGDNAVMLFRMHHFVREPVPIPAQYADRLYDFAAYPDTNDLLHVTDVLITDYSSVIYEYSLLERPMLFFAYDQEVYAATRGFHRDYVETAPGKVCANIDELVKAIATEDYETWRIARFREENFDSIDTDSADRVIDWLILDDPRTSRVATSEAARRDPSTGETALGDADISDQADA
jgi:CDP-ribitol ribitolphosphotransferase